MPIKKTLPLTGLAFQKKHFKKGDIKMISTRVMLFSQKQLHFLIHFNTQDHEH